MKKDLVMGWVFVGLALLMVFCIVYGCFVGNWAALPMGCFALILDIVNAISRFRDYKRRQRDWKDCMARFNDAFNACWPEDKPDDDNRITD
jgi:hypothetical protein